MDDRLLRLARWGGLLLALSFTVPGVLAPQKWTFLNNVNLIFHEAGHVLFTPFGETLMLMGGSLFQLIVPAVCAASFLLRADRYAAGVTGLWFTQSLANVSVYVKDAPTRNLDLITGDPDTHDWWQLFTLWNRMPLALPTGNFLHFLAVFTLVTLLLFIAWNEWQALQKQGV